MINNVIYYSCLSSIGIGSINNNAIVNNILNSRIKLIKQIYIIILYLSPAQLYDIWYFYVIKQVSTTQKIPFNGRHYPWQYGTMIEKINIFLNKRLPNNAWFPIKSSVDSGPRGRVKAEKGAVAVDWVSSGSICHNYVVVKGKSRKV